jgi:hypothetical protein
METREPPAAASALFVARSSGPAQFSITDLALSGVIAAVVGTVTRQSSRMALAILDRPSALGGLVNAAAGSADLFDPALYRAKSYDRNCFVVF